MGIGTIPTHMILQRKKDVTRAILRDMQNKITLRNTLLSICSITFFSSFLIPVFGGRVDKTFGGHMQFLTMIALSMTCLTLWMNQYTRLYTITYDLLVLSVVIETIVTVYYWGIFHYNRFWLYPKDIPPIPLIIDLLLHFLPAVALWLELLTTIKLHRVSRKHIYIIAGFSVAYMLWAEYCYIQNGYYVYPFLQIIDYRIKTFLTLATIVVAVIVYVISVQIHSLFW